MKKVLLPVLFIFTLMGLNAQLVISEIMFNPPESGSDSLEFIEIYNNSAMAIDMENYVMTQGVNFTFPAYTIGAGEYVVIAKDSLAMLNNFGVTAFSWTSGSTSNGGEDIAIADPAGMTIDSVDYDDNADWPAGTDGQGASLVLCDFDGDHNDPASWEDASTDAGFSINGRTVYANPGAPSQCSDGPRFKLTRYSDSYLEDEGMARVIVKLENPSDIASPQTVTLTLSASSTATEGADFMFTDTTLSFNSLDGPLYDTVMIQIVDDSDVESDETIFLELLNPVNGAVGPAASSITITIEDNDVEVGLEYHPYDIGVVTTNDADGVADSLGVLCQLQGIVYGVNQRPSGLQFTIIDNNNDGIGLFHFNNNFGYTVNEGDEVIIQGEISQFNGLTQIAPDTVWMVSAGNALFDPTVVTALDESTESQLTKIENLTIVDPTDWTNSGSGFNVDVTDGTNTYTMRIDNDVDLYGTAAPTDPFNLTGIGGQFDSSAPHDGGYQIFPRYIADIEIINNNDPDYPPYDIGVVTTNDADGVADSLGVQCQLQGVVYGVNQRPSGLQFTIIDNNNDGIGLFHFNNNFGYTVNEGDEVIIRGSIGQFNGLTQIAPDTVWMVSSGNTLFDPTIVTVLDELTESQLTKIENLTIVDPAEWTNSGSGFNVNVTDGTNTYTMRIDNDVDLYGTSAPTTPFNLTGLGGQFDSSAPHDGGYQILPRYVADIELITAGDLIRFVGVSVDVNENAGTVEIGVEYPAGDLVPWDATVALDAGSSTATEGMDFTFTDTTFVLSGFATDTVYFSIPIIDDAVFEGNETIRLTLSSANPGVDVSFDTYDVNIIDDEEAGYPAYEIGVVTAENADGVTDSLGVQCQLQGIVYGVNLRPAGLQFTIIDNNNDGIGLFYSSGNFGYTVNEGDEVIIQGTIGQFNGLTQIAPDTVWMVSAGNPLVDPTIITALDETTESQLVKIENLTIVDPADWTNSGSGFNVEVTDGTNTYAMRIDNDVDLYGTDVPTGAFNLTGLGGQFDSSSPYTSGYQLLPRYISDIDIIDAVNDPEPVKTEVYPNPVTARLTIKTEEMIDGIKLFNVFGQEIRSDLNQKDFYEVDMSNLPQGVYYINFLQNGNSWIKSVVKQ